MAKLSGHRWASICLAVLLLGYATVAAINGLGRWISDEGEPHGPPVFTYDTMAARALATRALANNAPAQALPLARMALLGDPVDAQVVGLIGRSEILLGHGAKADAAFRVSAGLGWRDTATQLYWYSRAFDLGDADMAAQRLDAVLRQDPGFLARDSSFADVTASPEGRAALAVRLAEHPFWSFTFYAPREALTPELLADRADVVRRMPKAALQCADVAPLVNRMLQANLLEEGQDLWSRACDPEPGLVHDGHFRRVDPEGKGGVTYFNWQLPASGTVELLFDEAADGARTLDMRVNGGISRSVLRQLTILAPGRYKLSWAMPEQGAAALAALRVGIGCTADRGVAVPAQSDPAAPGRAMIETTVDDTCRARLISFWLAPGTRVHISDVRLERVGA